MYHRLTFLRSEVLLKDKFDDKKSCPLIKHTLPKIINNKFFMRLDDEYIDVCHAA